MTSGTTVRRTPSAAGAWRWGERQRFFVDADRRIRASIPTSRRVAVLSLVGGAGTSTLAAGIATVAATRRATPVLAVDAAGARHGLGERMGVSPDARITGPMVQRSTARSFAEASAGLPTAGTLRYLGLGHTASASWPSDAGEWQERLAPIGRFFPLVITDWGRRADLRGIADIARGSHAVCLVAPADRAGLEGVAALVPALRADTTQPHVVVALVDRADEGPARTRVLLRDLDADVVRVPYDRALAEGTAPTRRTRRSLLAIAALLIGAMSQDSA